MEPRTCCRLHVGKVNRACLKSLGLLLEALHAFASGTDITV